MPGRSGGTGWNSAATRAQAGYGSSVTIATAVAGTLAAMSGRTITAPARVVASASRYLRLSRKLTSSGPALCSGATPDSISRRGAATASAASTTAARLCGPVRAKKRGSPAI